jgi:hypothetical protein
MNEMFFNTIKTVFALAAMQGKNLCFSPADGEFFEVAKRDSDSCTLYPLNRVGDEPCSPIFYFNPDELIFNEDLFAESQKNAFQTLRNAIETQPKRSDNADETQFSTQTERSGNADETQPTALISQDQHGIIGKGKVNLPRFSHLYSGDVAVISERIENYLDEIFASTNYAPTIKKTIANYQTAKKLAMQGNLYELSTLSFRLLGRINKQKAMNAAMDTVSARRLARRKMTISIALTVMIVAAYFVWKYYPLTADSDTPQTESAAVAVPGPESVFDIAIDEWQRKNNLKIYPAGRECLRKACAGLTDKAAILQVINSNMK